MKLLLDTGLLLLAAGEPRRLPRKARRMIADRGNELIFSAASLWEIAAKRRLGRSDFHADAAILRRALLDNGYTELPVTGEHTAALDAQPPSLKDLFDRVLVAQALVEGITLLTADRALARHGGQVRKV